MTILLYHLFPMTILFHHMLLALSLKNASVDDVLSSSYIVSSASVSWPYYDPMIVDSKVKYASYSTDVLKSNQSSRASVGIFIIALPFRILKLLMEFWRPTFLLMTLLQMSLFGYDFQL